MNIVEQIVARLTREYTKANGTVHKDVIAKKVQSYIEKLALDAFTADDDGTKTADVQRADIVQMLFDRADRAMTDTAKRAVKKLIEGEAPLPEICDVVIALGAGERCVFGAMRADEWERWDENHYRNLVDAQESYKAFRKMYDTAKPHLRAGAMTRDFWRDLP